MEKTQRSGLIDIIRGLSIIVMILIHTNTHFLHVKIAYITIEIAQFAVVFFIFCSAYLFFQKPQKHNAASFFSYMKKRLVRLLSPYYVFLFFYLVLVYIKKPGQITLFSLFQNIFLIGGLDFNWLVLLFIELALLFPFISFLEQKHKKLFVMYALVSLISSFYFLRHTPLPYYRWIMWLPWSLIPLFTCYFGKYKSNRNFLTLSLAVSGAVFALTRLYLALVGRSLRMYNNKYPPNIYHLSYGVFALMILYFAYEGGFFSRPFITKIIGFFSRYSYSLFFIHILVIQVTTVFIDLRFNWVSFFMTTVLFTVTLQLLLNRLLLSASRR